jgi:pyruvate,water dikinase
MMLPVTSASTASYARRELGGKGYRLYQMSLHGLAVPEWVGIPARAFRVTREQTPLGNRIREKLNRWRSAKDASECAREILEDVESCELPAEVSALIRDCYSRLGVAVVAVRSSAADEDSHRRSYAGQLSTFLGVRGPSAVEHAVRACWASAFSERVMSYRAQAGEDNRPDLDVSVILQRLAVCQKSGVLFTVDPLACDASVAVVSAVYGLGEGLVSGRLAADTVRARKSTGEILSQQIADKESALAAGPQGGVLETAVEAVARLQPVLSPGEVTALCGLARELETLFHGPQDIEWGFEDGALRVLQCRPVTALPRAVSGPLHIWDNSNIVESYGGITLPLTFTFARYVYAAVYEQFCEVLNVPRDEVRALTHSLQNMLGSFYGRVYYNLLNWYKLISVVPGFKANRRFMETMMGVSESLADEVAERIRAVRQHFSLRARLGRIPSALKILYFHFAIDGLVRRFLVRFHHVWDEFRSVEYSGMPAEEIYERIRDLEVRLLGTWHVPILNDFLCMVHFGILKVLTARWLGAVDPALQNDLLAADGSMESVEPTRELIRMAGAVVADPALRRLIEETRPEDALEALAQSAHSTFYERVRAYLAIYGFRCMDEMKLESRDLHQDPSFLFVCLQAYLRRGPTDLQAFEEREQEIRATAEATVRASLSLGKRLVYGYFLRRTRGAVRNRENTRFCRTRIYGVLRSMVVAVGEDLAARGLLNEAIDIFYLTVPEVYGVLDATLTGQDLAATVARRKVEYEAYREVEPLPRFMTRGIPYTDGTLFAAETSPGGANTPTVACPDGGAPSATPSGSLLGTACSPGIVEGTARTILSPTEDLALDGEILVAMRTDPGWIPLYPSIRGLLVEKGSLLSHSAVVAREMGLPTIVGISGLTRTIRTGMRVRMDGGTGIVSILPTR